MHPVTSRRCVWESLQTIGSEMWRSTYNTCILSRVYYQFFSFLNKRDSVGNWRKSTTMGTIFFLCWYPKFHFLWETGGTELHFHLEKLVNESHSWKTSYNSLVKKLSWSMIHPISEKPSVKMLERQKRKVRRKEIKAKDTQH